MMVGIVRGKKPEVILNKLINVKNFREKAVKVLSKCVKEECKLLCSKNNSLILRGSTTEDIHSTDFLKNCKWTKREGTGLLPDAEGYYEHHQACRFGVFSSSHFAPQKPQYVTYSPCCRPAIGLWWSNWWNMCIYWIILTSITCIHRLNTLKNRTLDKPIF